MDRIDSKEMQLASKAASSEKNKNIPTDMSFHSTSNRFEDFGTSEWFEDILDLLNSEIITTLANFGNGESCDKFEVFP